MLILYLLLIMSEIIDLTSEEIIDLSSSEKIYTFNGEKVYTFEVDEDGVEIDLGTFDSVNEYLSNNHDNSDYDLSFFIIRKKIYHNSPDFNIEFNEHNCLRISLIEDEIYKFLNDYIEKFPDNNYVQIHVTIKDLSNTITNCVQFTNDWTNDERINMVNRFKIVVSLKNETKEVDSIE